MKAKRTIAIVLVLVLALSSTGIALAVPSMEEDEMYPCETGVCPGVMTWVEQPPRRPGEKPWLAWACNRCGFMGSP